VTNGPVRVAVLDDPEGVAPELADWADEAALGEAVRVRHP
jgi:hypothetical protein